MKIDYSEFLRKYRTQETRREKVEAMYKKLVAALRKLGVHGKVNATYYTDGCVKVELDGEYFNMFCSVSERWFCGFVGE